MGFTSKQRRLIRISVGLILTALGLFFLKAFIFEALKLIIIAGAIALIVCPLCQLYEKRLPAAISAALSILTALIIIVGALAAIAIPLINSLADIYERIPHLIAKYSGALKPYISSLNLADGFSGMNGKDLLGTLSDVVMRIFAGAAGFAGTAADIAIAAVVAWYMLIGRQQLALRGELLIPSAQRMIVLRGAAEARLEIMMYLRGQSIIAVCVGLLSALGLFIVGIPSAISLGLTAGILNMIPYLGPIIACLPVGAIALTQGFLPCILSVGVLIAVQQIDGLILSPRIVGSSTGFAPSLVMIIIFAAGAVWGVLGMLVSIPAVILIRTCVRVFVELGHKD